MNGFSRQLVRALACAALLVTGLPAQSATLVAGSGANPPASATGIYEVAVLTTDAKRVMKALALVHKGSLKEVHSRSSAKYQRRAAGSAPIRITTATDDRLLALSGGSNRDVNSLPLATRCQYYTLAGLSTTGMGCPTPASGSTPVTVPPSNGTCPQGYEPKRSVVNGIKKLTCVLISFVPSSPDTEQWFASLGKYLLPYAQRTATWIDRLSPVSAAEARLLALRFDSALFLQPIKFTYESAEASATATSGWRFEGPGLLIVWIEDVVGG